MTHPTIRENLRIMLEHEVARLLDTHDITTIQMGGSSGRIVEICTSSGLWTAGRTSLEALVNLDEITRRMRERSEEPQTEEPTQGEVSDEDVLGVREWRGGRHDQSGEPQRGGEEGQE
jgi:hypothetical protein